MADNVLTLKEKETKKEKLYFHTDKTHYDMFIAIKNYFEWDKIDVLESMIEKTYKQIFEPKQRA